MFRKLFAAYLSLILAALALFGVVSARAARSRLLDEIDLRLEARASMLRPIVETAADAALLQRALSQAAVGQNTRLTVIGPDGAILADSERDPREMDNHNARPEVREARARGRGSHTRYSETIRRELRYVAVLLDPGRPDGVVLRSSLPLARIRSELWGLYRTLGLAWFAVALAGAAAAFVLARRLTRPLRRLEDAAVGKSAGDLARKIATDDVPEVRSVAVAMNHMAEELSARLDRLAAEQSKLDTVVSSMEEGVIAVDPEGMILHVNQSARRLFGIDGPAADQKLWEVVRITELESLVRGVLRDGRAARATLEMGPRGIETRVTPVERGRGAVVVARDVTEDRRYEALRKEFVANVSHELRTPLTLIRGYTETLLGGAWKDEAAAPGFLATIQANADRLSKIVEGLLDLSRLESGAEPLRRRRVDVPELLGKVVEMFRPLAEKKEQRLSVEAPPGIPALEADPDLLERAAANLVENALKFTPRGGRIVVRGTAAEHAVRIQVEDTGPGIPEKDLPRIFERFYRVEKSRSRDAGGTGLGLAIVKHIVQLHGGTVTAESRPGSGSVFTIELPRV